MAPTDGKNPRDKAKRALYMKAWRRRPENYDRVRAHEKVYSARQSAKPEMRERKNTQARESRKARWKADPDFRAREIANVKANYRRLRAAIVGAYGSRCECCGETEPMFLEIDHVNGGGARHFRESKSPVNVYREIVREGFPDLYRLLCANCNKGRQRNGGICPHMAARPSSL